MTQQALNSWLRRLKTPQPDDRKRSETLVLARSVLHSKDSLAVQQQKWHHNLQLLVPTFAVISFLLFLVFHHHDHQAPTNLEILATKEKAVLQQMVALFPTGLQAIVTRDGKSQIFVDDKDRQLPSNPVVVVLRKGHSRTEILSFSGQQIQTIIGDRSARLEFYVNGNGGVVVVGEDFVWTSENPKGQQPFSIEARTLGT